MIILLLIAGLLFTGCGSSLQNLQTKADSGDVKSQYELGELYYFGSSKIRRNRTVAVKYLKMAAQKDYLPAIFLLGRYNHIMENYTKAKEYYEKAVSLGDKSAITNLAIMYQHGEGVEKNLDKAIELLKLATKKGDYLASRNLGSIYRKQGNYEESIKAYKQSILDKTYKKNNYVYKQFASLMVMDMYIKLNNYEEAYIWGATSILTGYFDSPNDSKIDYFKIFKELDAKLTPEQKKALAPKITQNHYYAFVQYEPYFERNSWADYKNDFINVESKENIRLIGYFTYLNRSSLQTIQYNKGDNDPNAKLSSAIARLKIASSYITLGSIVPYYLMAKSEIEKAKKVIDPLTQENIQDLKEKLNAKYAILINVESYQNQMHEKVRLANK